jgi:hypothetical protein
MWDRRDRRDIVRGRGFALSPCARPRVQGSLPPVEQKPGLTQTEDILNSILPPR